MCKVVVTQAAGIALFAVVVTLDATVWAEFDLSLTTTGFTASQETVIYAAETLWEAVITGYQPGIAQTGIDVLVRTVSIDGPGGILGVAGPTGTASQAGFVLTTIGSIDVDRDDLVVPDTEALLDDLIAHELGHILGIGTQWTANGVYTEGSGEYVGPYGVAAYQAEFDAHSAFVPVELDGGFAMADAHWDDRTDVLDSHRRCLADALMTGVASGENFLSHTSVQSLRDIGFEVATGLTDVIGDVNHDGQVNGLDVAPFFDGLLNGSHQSVADMNQDGNVNGLDIDPFVVTVVGGHAEIAGMVIPEPPSLALLGLGLLGLAGLGRSRAAVGKGITSRTGTPARQP